ncbi:MAG: hypothetical protein NT094_02235 [Candidatus Staskawiczbacteria bacterium]|nr:hypothetical protein [Candidatus Staskawiczbacteria bacterium]
MNPEKNSLINIALEYLKEKSKDLFDLGVDIIFDPKKLIVIKLYSQYNYYPISNKIYNLKKSPYFSVKDKKIYLTKKGRIRIIKDIIKDKKENQRWNGKWLAIIFDIPEADRRERNFLRKELKWMGFKELQHSIWVTPYNIEKELLTLLNLWHKDCAGDIRFLKIDKIDDDKDLKNLFDL